LAESEAWRLAHTDGLKAAFLNADAVADRLALLRSWVRTAGGWLSASATGEFSAEDRALAERFAIAFDDFGVRLRVDELQDIAPDLINALRFEPAERRAFRSAPADAALLRFSSHVCYQSDTQKAALRALLTAPRGASLAVSMPTGSGKSLLFQAGPRAWRDIAPGACALVITPLVGLAQDHERTLRGLEGLETSRALHGSMTDDEVEEILFAFRRGEIPVLFMSPEIAFGRARAALLEAAKPSSEKFGLEARLSAVFIDEAHIIESWGRTFRPDFQRLPSLVAALRETNPDLVTVLLSATLSPSARTELMRAYGSPPWLEIHAGVPRYDFDIVTKRFEAADVRQEAILRAVDLCPRPTIVYTTRVRDASDLHNLLRDRGYRRIALFTGETGAAARQDIIDRWAAGDLDLVVATSAFGLGIDKANVRTVIHACLPESAARWYQEIGRGGRDGHQALALLLWSDDPENDDVGAALSMASRDWLTRPYAEEHWEALRDSAEVTWLPGARRQMMIPLDAAPLRLGQHTGSHNRRWNQSLINLMQRAGVLEVMTVEERRAHPTWEVILHRDELLGDGTMAAPAWDDIFQLRDAEQANAVSEARSFVNHIRGRGTNCLLAGAFSLIEPEVWDAPPCGRCARCREHRLPVPERIASGGLEAVWAEGPDVLRGPTGRLLISPERVDPTGRSRLLLRLARAGLQQLVVPDDWASEAATIMAAEKAPLGLVLPVSDWLDGRWGLANLPTGAVLSEDQPELDRWMARVSAFSLEFPKQRLVLVAESSARVDGRRLDQIASTLGSYPESFLDSLVDEVAA
jgi:ATP-dependent DNA helicase RecQ